MKPFQNLNSLSIEISIQWKFDHQGGFVSKFSLYFLNDGKRWQFLYSKRVGKNAASDVLFFIGSQRIINLRIGCLTQFRRGYLKLSSQRIRSSTIPFAPREASLLGENSSMLITSTDEFPLTVVINWLPGKCSNSFIAEFLL